jgi:hypothetical protein
MSLLRLTFAVCLVLPLCSALRAADHFFGENLIEVKLTLPKGDTYMRGATDPVSDLMAEITLTNKTAKENLNRETVPIEDSSRLTSDEYSKLQTMTREEQVALLEKKKVNKELEVYSVNKDSLGVSYVEPELGPHDFVNVVITKVPEEGQPAPEKPVVIPRDNKPDHVSPTDLAETKYLAAGETTKPIVLPVGRYYLIRDPGKYTIKVVLYNIADNDKPSKFAESNEETFRVLPFKVVGQKINEIRSNWEQYERGTPSFNYMIYQVMTGGGYDEIWYVQRISVRKMDTWEWTRLCSVKDGTQAQLAQLSPTKVKVVAVQAKGDLGIYELDFSNPGATVKASSKELKGDTIPKLGSDGTLAE